MKAKSFPDFYRELQQNTKAQEQLKKAKDRAQLIDTLLGLGRQQGLSFTPAEVAAHLDAKRDLSDADLAKVAGGVTLPVVKVKPPPKLPGSISC